ncbi:MAG: XRE family transcriptional regulator [Candidatus Abyssubacteria bacterium]
MADIQEMHVGEKVKKLREEKGMSLAELAEKSGFSSALLSQIENHMISPPLGTLIKLAGAMDVSIGHFFEDKADAPFVIVRAEERRHVSRVASKEGVKFGYRYESLAQDKKNRFMEPFLVTLEPATKKDRNAYSHEGEEFIFVLDGEMEVTLEDHTDVLKPGDCIYFDSRLRHRVECVGDKETRILAVIHAPHK